MKIGAVGFCNLNRKQKINNKAEDVQNRQFCTQTSPIYAGKAVYPISFLGCADFTKIKGLSFKNMRGLPDPVSGIIMVPQSDFLNILTEKVLSNTSRQAIKVISQFEENMFPVEKEAFQIVTKLSKKAPSRTLQELFGFVQPEFLIRLKVKQSKIIAQMEEAAKKMSIDSQEDIFFITEKSKKLIAEKEEGEFFKRKSVIKQLSNLENRIPEKDLLQDILKLASDLPESGNDIDAFMVKYAKKDRDSFEIGKRFVSPSVGTIEHITPSCSGGEDLASNKIVESYKYNNEKNFYLLQEQIEKHPEMIKNVQKHIDVIVKFIKSGQIKGYDWYPAAMQKKFTAESNGIINIKIPEEFKEALTTGVLPTNLVLVKPKTKELIKDLGNSRGVLLGEKEAYSSSRLSGQKQVEYESDKVFSRTVPETQNDNLIIINNILKKIKSKNPKKAPDPISTMNPRDAKKAINAMNATRAKIAKSAQNEKGQVNK